MNTITRIHLLAALCATFILNDFNLKAQTYAGLPFTETFENAWVNKNGTRDVPSVYWKNTPTTGVNSWSRDDDGIARGAWTYIYVNSPAAANGSLHSASFNSWEANLSGTLDLYVNFGTLAGTKALYFWYINTSGDDKFEVSVSTDGGTTFGAPLITLYNKASWTKICLDLGTLTTSTGVIRFKGSHVTNQNSPISIDDVYVGAHSATPIVADFSTDRISGIAPLTVNFTDKSTGDVTNWSWDFNNDGTVDATTQNSVYTFNAGGTYTAKLTSSKPGSSNTKTTTISITPQSYATLPFIENFDHAWVNREGTRDVPSLSFKNNPYKGDNSWRRNDDGSSAGWVGIAPPVDYSPSGSQSSQYSARFHSAATNLSGTLDAFIDFSTQTGNKTLSFWYINPSGSDKLEISLSTDGGVTFGAVLITKLSAKQWVKVIYDLGNITSSTGVIRFKATGDDGGLDMGLDDVRVSNPTEIPIDASFTSDKTSGPGPLTVNFIDQSGGAPTSWEWDFNNDGVIDATTQNPTYTYNSSGIYTVKLTVRNAKYSGEVILTNYIVVPGYAGLPYLETFENSWVNRDNVRDVPNNFWKGNPATGNNSWSREDDGMFRGAWSTDYGLYSPKGANGSLHSACFDTRDVYNGTGSFDLFVNFSTQTGEKRLSFWYLNKGGNDKLEVFQSTDGGTTFGAALTSLGVSGIWTKVTINLGNVTSATGVLRFKATTINWDPTETNIGIDDVNVVVPALLPLNAEFTQNIIAGNAPLTVNFVDLSEGAPTSWNWDFNNDGTVDATTQNASYTYNSTGKYSVKLTASKAGIDNVELKNKYILVTGYSSLPFSESFENPWVSRDGYKDTPSEFAKNTPAVGNDSWSREDEGYSRGAWSDNSYSYSPAGANNSSHSARFHTGWVTTSGTLDFYLNFSTMSGDKELKFWYINTYGTDKLEIFLSTDGGATFGSALKTLTTSSTWTRNTLSLGTSASATCVLRFKATGDFGTSDIGLDEIKINMVEAGFAANILSGATPLTATFTDQSLGNPTSWKWDFNNDGVIDATIQNPVYTYTTSGKYTVKLIASKTGSSDTIVKKDYITLKPVHYAPLPFTETFENSWVNLDQTRDVPSNCWINSPATGNNSWSRDDDGVSRGAWGYSYASYTPAGANGSLHSARFHSYQTTLSNNFDLFVDFSTLVGNKTLYFWYINTSGTDGVEVLLSTDGGATFNSLTTVGVKSTWTRIAIPIGSATSPTGVIRIKATGDNGNTDIGIDEIKINTLETAFTANVLSGVTPQTITFTDQTLGSPTSWKWDFNNDGVIDATVQNPVYTYTTSGKYTVKLITLKTGSSDTLVKKDYITVKPIYYAALPFKENFENSWINLDQTRDVPSNNWSNNPATGNNSWSRDDDGVSRGAWSNLSGSYTPAGANGSLHSARFHSWAVSSSNNFDLYLNFSTLAGDKTLYFWYINTSGTDSLKVYLSADGGATFSSLTLVGIKSTWSRIVVPIGNVTSPTGIIRFKATGDFGYTDIGIDEIKVTTVEAGFAANVLNGATPLTVTFNDQSSGSPTSWKWDFNNDGVIDATVQNPVYTYTTPGKYTVKLIALTTGLSDTIVKKDYISLKPIYYASVPFIEDFEKSWVNSDQIRDVPSTNWSNSPATGNNSWSRDDDGLSRGAWSNLSGSYIPAGVNGSLHSARFHSYNSSSSNNFDLYVNFSTLTGDKNLCFWYINTNGTDGLEVQLSTDGVTFNSLTTLGTKSTWSKIVVNIGNISSPTGIIRFKAKGDIGVSDIGIDEIKINTIDAGFSADILNGATPLTVSFTDQSSGNPTSWKWDFNNDGVIDATVQNPVYTFSTAGKYTVKLIVLNAGSSDTIVKSDYITLKPINYATLPFSQNFDSTWVNLDQTRDVPSNNWSNNPATGNNSWSRDDDGVSRGAWTNQYGSYTPAGANGSLHSARFHSYSITSSNNFDLYINFSTLSGIKALYFWYINVSGTDSLKVLLSTDGGATFNSIASIGTKNVWSKIAIDLNNTNSSIGIIRFKATGDYGSSDIGIDEIFVGTTSTTSIVPAFQTTSLSGMAPFKVNFTDQSTGDVTSWKWDFNGDGVIESTLQNPSFIYATPGTYSVKLITSKRGMTDSIVKPNLISIAPQVYATVPFKEGFDKTWINRDNTRDVPSNYFLNNPSYGNNSWTRSDDIYRTWTSYSTSPMSGALNTPYAARFNSYGSNLQSGVLDIFLDFTTQFGIQQLSFWYLNTAGTDKLEVYLSKDGGATFGSALQTLTTAANWTKITIDLGFVYVSKGVIRFKATGDGGSTNIGIDEIVVCDPSSTPITANFLSNISTGNKPLTVNFTDQSVGAPSFWKWDFNNDGVTDSITKNPSYTYTSSGVYSVKMIAGNADSKDSITKINYIVVPGYASLPFSENFENDWANRDGLRDVPSYYYKNNPSSGINSWSRSDDGLLRLAWPTTYGQYYPEGANNSSRSARFHSYATSLIGIMDLFVDFSTLAGDKTLSFWYINTSGTDSLNVYLSTDGGATDGTFITTKKVASTWTKITVDLGNISTTTGVIRFKAKGDYGSSDIGVDDITIGTTGVVAVDAKFSSNVTYGLVPFTSKFTDQSTGTPISWKWDFDGDGKVDSISKNPSFTYTKVGKYSVSLEISGAGTTDKETKVDYIAVYDKVKADFSADKTEGFAPFIVNFIDKSAGAPTTWKWDFDNNGTTDATTQNASYSYTQPGSYSVKLIISNPVSNDTIIKTLLIKVKGKASLPYAENFEDNWKSYQATRDVPSFNWINSPAKANYSWSRDDDGVARGAWNSNNAAYSPAGADGSLHSARFHTYDFMSGYLSSFSLNVDFSILAGNKTLSFYYINPGGTDKLNVYLSTNGGTSFGSAISTQTTSSAWTKVTIDLGNVTSANGVILFDVTADLDNTDIGIDELSIQTTGVTPVSAQFTSNVITGIVPLTIKFTDQSTGSPTSWQWDFNNDGVMDSTTQNPSYVFSKAGVYTVRLVSSKLGSTDSEVKLSYITVVDPVDAKFTADKTSGIGPLTVAFTDQSTGNPTSWRWDFNNDGVVDATTQNPAYTFNSAGTYTVKLVVYKTNSTDSVLKTSYIVVSAPVAAEFTANKTIGIAPVTISFTDQSTGNPTSWSWDFNNDGIVDATTKNPSYTFSSTGIYTVSLTSSKIGSSNKKTKTEYITVIDPINADFVADKITGKAPLTVKFTDKSSGSPTSWSWDFNNDGMQDSITQNPTFTFKSIGTYTVKLVVSKLGFNDTEVKTGYIVVTPSTGFNTLNLPDRIISIYPSPASTWVKMKLENFENDKVKLEIIDLQGTIISTLDLTGQESHDFDFSAYVRGIYYLKTYCKDRVFINKLVLQ